MKQFIYLDSDSVNSLIAQINNGIEDSYQLTNEKSSETATEKSTIKKSEVKAGIKAPIIANIGSNIVREENELSNSSDNEIIKEIHNKRLHDAAFNELTNYLENEEKLNNENKNTGSFIKIEDSLDIIDFEYLSGLFKENAFVSYLKETQENEIRNKFNIEQEGITKEQRKRMEYEIKKQIGTLISENNKQYENVEKMINALKHVIPYKRMALSSQGFLLPLDEKWFRDAPDLLGFKYGGKFTFIGYITNVINNEGAEPNIDNIFTTLQTVINQALFMVLPSDKKQLYILHPIALYFEC